MAEPSSKARGIAGGALSMLLGKAGVGSGVYGLVQSVGGDPTIWEVGLLGVGAGLVLGTFARNPKDAVNIIKEAKSIFPDAPRTRSRSDMAA